MYTLVILLTLPYLLLLIKIYRGLLGITGFTSSKDSSLFISVIIPCKNEEKSLPFLLESINCQEYDFSRFEVIVVNDNSTDNTTGVAFSFNSRFNIKVVSNNGNGKKRAIRTGVNLAQGELIITCDADCTVPGKWLSTIGSFYEENNPAMIICPLTLSSGSGFAPWFQELEFLSLQAVTAGTACNNNPSMCNGANLAFTKKIYSRYSSGLNDNIPSGDDIFLLHNIKKDASHKILWLESEEAKATTRASSTLNSFISQRARWISKAGAYNDIYTKGLALATLITVILQATLMFMSMTDPVYIKAFLTTFIVKSIPDFLILNYFARKERKEKLIKWFVPVQLIYPFYVLAILIKSLIPTKEWASR